MFEVPDKTFRTAKVEQTSCLLTDINIVSYNSGPEKQQRSLLNNGMLMARDRGPELAVYIRGARKNSLSELEIREAILHYTTYCGVPVGVKAMKIAERVLNEMSENGEKERELGCKAE